MRCEQRRNQVETMGLDKRKSVNLVVALTDALPRKRRVQLNIPRENGTSFPLSYYLHLYDCLKLKIHLDIRESLTETHILFFAHPLTTMT